MKIDSLKEFSLSNQFELVRPCSDGLFIIGNKILPAGEHLKYGVVDSLGRFMIPMSFISIHEEIGRFFRVRRLLDDKTAVLDLDGHVVVDYGQYLFLWPFFGNYIKVAKRISVEGAQRGWRYGLLDTELRVALPCDYYDIFPCPDLPNENTYGIRLAKNASLSFVSCFDLTVVEHP